MKMTNMKQKIEKLLRWRPQSREYLLMMLLALGMLLYPLLRLTRCSVPWYDDYNYGRFVKSMIFWEGFSLKNILTGVWESVRTSWYAWQGTYSSIFFMSLTPIIWGEEYYFLGPAFLILLLTVSVIFFLYTLLRTILHTDRVHALAIGIGGSILALELIYTAKEGFYWYNGGVHYVGMHSFLLLLITLAVRMVQREKTRGYWVRQTVSLILALVLAVVAAGANFVTALQGVLVLASVFGLGCILRKRNVLWLLPVMPVYGKGFSLNVSAPGNVLRANNYIGWGMPAWKAVPYSFVEGGKRAWQFTGWMAFVILFLMLPIILHAVSSIDFSFRLPGVVSLWSVCLYATGFTPSLYSLGHGGLSRTLNAVKLTWQMLLVINVVYWCGWIWKRKKGAQQSKLFYWWFYPLIAVMVLLVFHTEINQAGSFSSYGAYYYIHTGEADNFYRQYLERVEKLKGEEQQVGLEPYIWKPWFLCMGDLSEDPGDETNRALAGWYDKETVFLLPQE